MARTEISGTAPVPSKAVDPAPIYLRNGLCLRSIMSDVAEFGTIGSDHETFRQTLARTKDRRLTQRFPGHKTLEEIGRGGMGVVYRAREIRSDRIVALKCVLADSVDEVSARFRREAKIASSLDHPNIVPVHCVSDTRDGLPFFTMKFAQGGTLQQALPKFQDCPKESVRLILRVALAIQYAHERGILHRDLKPANILLDERGEPLVSDFGLAKSLDGSADVTRTLAVLGTAGYLAPEQAQGPRATVTAAADIYSLGAILFELLTGRTPFIGDQALDIIRQVTEKDAPRLRSLAPHLDRALETICARCLHIEPGQRFASAGALAHDLENWLEARPIVARTPGIGAFSSRWLRRNRLSAALAVAVLFSGTLVFRSVYDRRTSTGRVPAPHTIGIGSFISLDNLVADRNVTESISASLEDFGSLSVKSLNEESVSTYETADEIKIIGRAGNVRAILTGFTRAIGDKQEVSFRLLDATSGEPILISSTEWGINAQDGETRRGFGRMIAGALSPQRPSASIDPGLSNHVAKEAIEAGRYLSLRYTIEDLDRAITLFQKAIEVAPGSSLAHAYLAFAATARTHYVADWSYLTMGRAAAQKAIELDPISGQAHRALGSVYYQEGQFKNALEQGLRTIECGNLNAKSIRFVGLTFAQIGRLDKSIAWYRLASQVEGTPGDVDFLIGDCLAKLGDDELAVAAYTRSAELQPTQSQAWTGLCHLRILQGDFQTARNLCRAGKWNQSDLGDGKAIAAQIEFLSRDFATADRLYSDLAAADPEGGGAFYGLMSYESALGRIKLARGQTENGNHLLRRCLQRERAAVAREPENPEAFYRLAAVESSLGELERGLDYLEMSMKLGFIDKRSLLIDPRFDALHTNPRFARIIQNLSARLTEMKIAVEKRKLIATNHE